MASNNFKVHSKYDDDARYAVYGSVAYDLNALPEREYEELPEKSRRSKARAYSVEKPKQGISLFAVAGFALFAVMMVFVLLARVQLTQISDETAKIETKISELSEEEARLRIEYERTFNLTEIEEYATKKLGMIRQGSDSVTFLAMTNVDRAEILVPDETGGNNFITGFKDFLSSLLEYF
jgi:cell division protein FtsL